MRICALLLAAAAISTLVGTAAHSAPPANVASAAEVRLAHISVVKSGSGPAVVLIPGLSSPRAVWDGVAPNLARGHTVYMVQVNGFAGDDPGANLAPGLLDGVVADLHAYLAKEHAGPVPIVGHSMGGLLGLMLAGAHPQDVKSLMVVDAFPFVGAMFDEKATMDTVRPIAAMMKTRIATGFPKEGGDAAAEATAKGLAVHPDSVARVKAWVLAANSNAAAEALYEDLTTDLRPQLKAISAPITLVHPAEALGKDIDATAEFYRRQYAGAQTVQLIAVPDSGHFIMLDQPGRFLTELNRFLR